MTSRIINCLYGIFGVVFILLFNSCNSDDQSVINNPTSKIPSLSTTTVSAITQTSSKCGGTITSDGGTSITARGVCWNTITNPTISNNRTNDGNGTGSFSSTITGLQPGTYYFVRAYATNSSGTGYGNQITFTTLVPNNVPVLTTSDVTSITKSTAKCGGNISSDGGFSITSRGVCWSTNPSPSITNSKTNDGTAIGSFTSLLTGLIANTTYYIRAYATNSQGTGYGIIKSFVTLSSVDVTIKDVDGNTYNTITIGNQTWMKENLRVIHYRNGDPISTLTSGDLKKYCWYNNNPTLYKQTYGALYTWWAVTESLNICPTGWHVPSANEWKTLSDTLGGDNLAGNKLRETGTSHWVSPNTGATNSSGFTALPGGFYVNNEFVGIGSKTEFWSSTQTDKVTACQAYLNELNFYSYYSGVDKACLASVRCIKD